MHESEIGPTRKSARVRCYLVSLSVGVQVMNALLLPIVLGFLYLLARRLPEPHRLRGGYAGSVAVIIAVSVIFGVYSGIAGLWG
jgi:hypothetical protein